MTGGGPFAHASGARPADFADQILPGKATYSVVLTHMGDGVGHARPSYNKGRIWMMVRVGSRGAQAGEGQNLDIGVSHGVRRRLTSEID